MVESSALVRSGLLRSELVRSGSARSGPVPEMGETDLGSNL